eukprot:scaffold3747_cov32-Tisochrysis_lutea.AAC.2
MLAISSSPSRTKPWGYSIHSSLPPSPALKSRLAATPSVKQRVFKWGDRSRVPVEHVCQSFTLGTVPRGIV